MNTTSTSVMVSAPNGASVSQSLLRFSACRAWSMSSPQLGVGAIYPLPESDIVVPRFEIPAHWPRVYGLDVGWRYTAAAFLAIDRDTQRVYLYHEYKRAQAEPVVHAEGIKAPGAWIPGVIDPASMGSGQIDGRNLMQLYSQLGLDLTPAVNAVESGIFDVWGMLSTGKLKVFDTCPQWLSEFRKYHRDEKGRIVKADDHLLDATRYAVVSGLAIAKQPPVPGATNYQPAFHPNAWMG